jgi:hypothetical protein
LKLVITLNLLALADSFYELCSYSFYLTFFLYILYYIFAYLILILKTIKNLKIDQLKIIIYYEIRNIKKKIHKK